MLFHFTVVANQETDELELSQQLQYAIASMVDVRISQASRLSDVKEWGQILMIDSSLKNLHELLNGLDRSEKAVFLVVPEEYSHDPEIMTILDAELVDDVLIQPFRTLEVLSKIRHYQQILLWDEVKQLSASFNHVLGQLQEDVKLAERIQKSKFPLRFPNVKGFDVSSRYLVGMKSGGDFFDLAEAKNGNQMSIILSDSSSYGLSSAILSVLMRVAMKLTANELRSCNDTLEKIWEEVALSLNEKDRLSLFYAIVSRKDYRLNYLNFGSSRAFYAPSRGQFRILDSQGEAITQKSGFVRLQENQVALEPDSRLVLLSDGFIEAVGGQKAVLDVLEKYRDQQSKDLLNELVFQVKAQFHEPDEMPVQDCTALVFDADAKLLRVA